MILRGGFIMEELNLETVLFLDLDTDAYAESVDMDFDYLDMFID